MVCCSLIIFLYCQDVGGDENWHVWSVDLDTQLARDLTPFQGVRADAIFVNKKHPQAPHPLSCIEFGPCFEQAISFDPDMAVRGF